MKNYLRERVFVVPRFVVLVELAQQHHAPEPFGWADEMAKIIRQKWPKDAFDVKVKIMMA